MFDLPVRTVEAFDLPLRNIAAQEHRMDRSLIKNQRLNLPLAQQQACARRIAEQVCAQDFFKHCQHIAFYLPIKGEVDTRWIVEEARKANKKCYLPVLAQNDCQHLCFMPFDEDTKFVSNQFNIPEPTLIESRLISPDNLDLVIAPLVAFDQDCHRIGMGAGFYDRTFAFLQTSPRPIKPLLCGLAYAFQQVDNTHPQPWDVTLDYVISEEKIYARSI